MIRLGRVGVGGTSTSGYGVPHSLLVGTIERAGDGKAGWFPGLIALPLCRRAWDGSDFVDFEGRWRLDEDYPRDFRRVLEAQLKFLLGLDLGDIHASTRQLAARTAAWHGHRWIYATHGHHPLKYVPLLPAGDLSPITATWFLTHAPGWGWSGLGPTVGQPNTAGVAPAEVDYLLRARERSVPKVRHRTLQWLDHHFGRLGDDAREFGYNAGRWTRKALRDKPPRTLGQLSDRVRSWEEARDRHFIHPFVLVDHSTVVSDEADLVRWMRQDEFVRLLDVLGKGRGTHSYPIAGEDAGLAELAAALKTRTLLSFQVSWLPTRAPAAPAARVQWAFGEPTLEQLLELGTEEALGEGFRERARRAGVIRAHLPEVDSADLLNEEPFQRGAGRNQTAP